MGSPVSPIIANINVEHFEEKSLRTAQNPRKLWNRYLDDTFVEQHLEHKENFLQHTTRKDQSIKFPVEDT